MRNFLYECFYDDINTQSSILIEECMRNVGTDTQTRAPGQQSFQWRGITHYTSILNSPRAAFRELEEQKTFLLPACANLTR